MALPFFCSMTMPLHIVLYQPEIPPNTGNIARLCACTGCALHLIHPLGFEISDRQLKRAGLDYWKHVEIHEHPDWAHVRDHLGGRRRWYGFSAKARQKHWDARFEAGDVLVFGPETRGLPGSILDELQPLRIPMRQDAPVRSLNLSSACAVAVFEALRQLQYG